MNQQKPEVKMKAQQKMMQQQAQDAEVLGFGWHNFGVAFLAITTSIVLYAAFF